MPEQTLPRLTTDFEMLALIKALEMFPFVTFMFTPLIYNPSLAWIVLKVQLTLVRVPVSP